MYSKITAKQSCFDLVVKAQTITNLKVVHCRYHIFRLSVIRLIAKRLSMTEKKILLVGECVLDIIQEVETFPSDDDDVR